MRMDKAAFIAIDRLLFDRLSRGDPGPITVTLVDGTEIVGEPIAIARGGAVGAHDGAPWGRITVLSGGDPIPVDYVRIRSLS